MRVLFFIALFIIVLGAIHAQARLGETESQCIARYGAPVEAHNAGENGAFYRTLYFDKSDYSVICCFLNGYCGFLYVQKKDKSQLEQNEIQLLLGDNADGRPWQKKNDLDGSEYWDRDDGANAQYSTLEHSLTFMSKDMINAEEVRKKNADTQKLNGF